MEVLDVHGNGHTEEKSCQGELYWRLGKNKVKTFRYY